MKKKMGNCKPITYEIRMSEILIFSRYWPKALYYVFLTCFKLWPVRAVTRSWNELQAVSWSGTVHSHLIIFTATVLSLYYFQFLSNLSRTVEITRLTDWSLLKTLECQLYFWLVLLCQSVKLKKVLSVFIIRS